ncbi:[LSU ribosomal protein L11P]-lysine N-methyltransferase [Ekhidna lutea]|uniref:Ribosomal protein L11 methyltransferase n=1 Tax=Ekhidna lutea TaxID=447679 RepID=A0A239EUM7_EKHLU|nr:50S ribosomal protein L11 methyltransferase [Ekhidna lutea]SNS48480.1 [LSU ribosomal protein L11P]-lysine N-methyltransferase [Ekhidna lutea]
MDFITIKVTCDQALIDVLIAELFEVGFDSFQEFDDGFEGSCEQSQFDDGKVEALFSQYSNVAFTVKEQEKVNWNEEWEKNYDPIIVGDKCIVRASFHKPQPQFEYEIIVTPKMSFGTGHHATTYQVLDYQMTLDHKGKRVLDVGTGTGILAIMAEKRGASNIAATDIDDWCIENSEENFSLNDVKDVTLIKGQIAEVKDSDYDIVIANINKNVLMDQMNDYAERLVDKGHLILSGFYESDIEDLEKQANEIGLKKIHSTTRDKWAMLALEKRSI